jgi:large subunit ribosomal protein L18
LQSAILDIGLRRASKGSKIFAALKGALDAGVDIPHGVEILPQESRIRGEHISTYGVALASQKERVGFQFSRYLDKKGGPEIILSEFDKIKQRIIGEEKESLKVEKK